MCNDFWLVSLLIFIWCTRSYFTVFGAIISLSFSMSTHSKYRIGRKESVKNGNIINKTIVKSFNNTVRLGRIHLFLSLNVIWNRSNICQNVVSCLLKGEFVFSRRSEPEKHGFESTI